MISSQLFTVSTVVLVSLELHLRATWLTSTLVRPFSTASRTPPLTPLVARLDHHLLSGDEERGRARFSHGTRYYWSTWSILSNIFGFHFNRLRIFVNMPSPWNCTNFPSKSYVSKTCSFLSFKKFIIPCPFQQPCCGLQSSMFPTHSTRIQNITKLISINLDLPMRIIPEAEITPNHLVSFLSAKWKSWITIIFYSREFVLRFHFIQ